MAEKRILTPRRAGGSRLLTVWQWLFNLSLTAVFITLLLNWPELLLRLRLASQNSIFQSGWLVLAAMTLVLLLTAMVHELGHLLAGYLVRFRFQTVVVGLVRVSRVNGRLQLQRQRGGSLFNGLAASLPSQMDNLAWRLFWFAMGGPIASLLLSLAAFAVVLYLGSELRRMLDYLWLWECSLFAAISAYFFLLTSLRPGSYHNGMMADGGRIAMLLARSAEAERWQALVQLNAADLNGERPSAWNRQLLREALTLPDNSHDYLTALVMNYHHELDKKRPQQALPFLEEALNLPVAWVAGMRPRLAVEKAYVVANFLQDLETAQNLLVQVKIGRGDIDPLFCRAEAALLLLQGQPKLAGQSAARGLQPLPDNGFSGVQIAEREWLQTLLQQASSADNS
ncbi:MAG: M50 family metallopeptidase [Anaerolineaceae bacterium]|nr:M50 family metallopeptidase [Anaerolineaceae bacterium]